MAQPLEIIIAAIGGGGGTFALQTLTGWWKARSDNRRSDRDADVKLEQHRDQLTFDLLTAARVEMSELRTELATLRPLSGRIALLEEALDHLHALLHAGGEAERQAAERRARAFLRRMRPEPDERRQAAPPIHTEHEMRARHGVAPRQIEEPEI